MATIEKATIEKSIDVDVPVRTAYNQWTQFEEFPKFMEGVTEVRQLDDKRLHWKAEIGGQEREWDAEIYEQVPDKRIAWGSILGKQNAGVVRFEPLGSNRTRIYLRIDYDPEGIMENAAQATGIVSARVEGDLERFKDFIEKRGVETGAWRGEIRSAS
jgi:uncharacterized membrane protein